MQENLLKIDLQLFAEGEEAEEEKKENSQEETSEAKTQEDSGLPKTQEELDALIARRVEREKKKSVKKEEEPLKEEGSKATPGEPNQELQTTQRELLMARAQLEAFHNGVKSDVVEDAVYLAIREAEKEGDASEEKIKEALKEVLKRHPSWKSTTEQEASGFKVGATGGKGTQPSENALAEIFGNK